MYWASHVAGEAAGVACAAGNAVLDVVLAPGFLAAVDDTARYLWRGLEALARQYPGVFTQPRGAGLICGLQCALPNTQVQNAALAQGLLTVAAGDNVLRLVPPLIIGRAECDEALALLGRAAQACQPAIAEALTP